jgi:hypothetical protein
METNATTGTCEGCGRETEAGSSVCIHHGTELARWWMDIEYGNILWRIGEIRAAMESEPPATGTQAVGMYQVDAREPFETDAGREYRRALKQIQEAHKREASRTEGPQYRDKEDAEVIRLLVSAHVVLEEFLECYSAPNDATARVDKLRANILQAAAFALWRECGNNLGH